MSNSVIIHIPHSSFNIPDIFYPCFLDEKKIQNELQVMTDWYTDELFDCGFGDSFSYVIHKYSRLICDPERFLDPVDEVMFSKGMGMYYTNSYDNTKLKKNPFENLNGLSYYSMALQLYYAHHNKFNLTVGGSLKEHDYVIIVDAHSFSNVKLPYEEANSFKRPDICIGTDGFYTSDILKNHTKIFFENYGLYTAFNIPYTGTIVPFPFLKDKNDKLQSIMIEVNKKLYLQDDTSVKSENFYRIKSIINEYLNSLLSLNLNSNIYNITEKSSGTGNTYKSKFTEITDVDYICKNLKVNDIVNHDNYGRGTITEVVRNNPYSKDKFEVKFDKTGISQTFLFDVIESGCVKLITKTLF